MRVTLIVALLLANRPALAQTPDTTTVPGRASLLVFFATWCVPCRVELPHMEALYRRYRERGLRVQLISEDAPSTAANVLSFLARFDVTAPWVIDDDSELLVRYHPSGGLPFVVLLDATGQPRYAHAGYEPGDEHNVEAAIRAVLREAPAEPTLERQWGASSTNQVLGAVRESRFEGQGDGRLLAAATRLELTVRSDYGEAPGVCGGDGPCASLTSRVDLARVVDEALPHAQREQRDARLERLSAQLQWGALRLRGGDTHAAFGHGLSLSLRRVDQLGVDVALRGARADARFGPLELTAIGGLVNSQNLDPVLFRARHDNGEPVVPEVAEPARDEIAGTQVTLHLGERQTAGAYAMLARAPSAAAGAEEISWVIGGATTTVEFDGVRLAADAAVGRRVGFLFETVEVPWAIYASAAFDLGPTSTVVEVKAYRHWEIGNPQSGLLFHEPPTLEREDQQVPANNNALGGRVRTDWHLRDGLTVYGNVLAYRYDVSDTADLIGDGDFAWHAYAGGDWMISNILNGGVASGARHEVDADGDTKLWLWHLDADLAWSILPWLSATAKWNHVTETKIAFESFTFQRGLGVLGFAIPGWVTLSALFGYSTENADQPTVYPAGELKVFLPKGGEARLFVGRLTGGRVCVSGSCRDVPPFEGARLDLIVRL